MATKRKSLSNSNKFFNSKQPTTSSFKLLPEPESRLNTFLTMTVHIVRKFILINTKSKVCFYLFGLFLISIITDYYPIPKSYFSNSKNVFNQYFIKMGWGWTLLATVPFNLMTSYVLCCGRSILILKHISRLVIATLVWYSCTSGFVVIHTLVGACTAKNVTYSTPDECYKAGFNWQSYDISGHAFILMYSALVIVEEASTILNWEDIKLNIRNEEHLRSINYAHTALKNLNDEEFKILKESYKKYTPFINGHFLFMSLLVVLWDCMLLSTALYFHVMGEKLLAGLIAASAWFLTYKVWYVIDDIPPSLPGKGLFVYSKKQPSPTRWKIPKFNFRQIFEPVGVDEVDENVTVTRNNITPATNQNSISTISQGNNSISKPVATTEVSDTSDTPPRRVTRSQTKVKS